MLIKFKFHPPFEDLDSQILFIRDLHSEYQVDSDDQEDPEPANKARQNFSSTALSLIIISFQCVQSVLSNLPRPSGPVSAVITVGIKKCPQNESDCHTTQTGDHRLAMVDILTTDYILSLFFFVELLKVLSLFTF